MNYFAKDLKIFGRDLPFLLGFNACVVDLFKDFLVADVVKDLGVPGVVDLLEDPSNLVLHLAARCNGLVHLQYFSTDDDNDCNV